MECVVERYLAELVRAARQTLGSNLVAAYGAGSIALGAYQPGRSDIDVALVCEDALGLEQKQTLVSRLRHEALPCPARGLELVLYRRTVAQSGTPEPGFEVELNTGARMEFRATYTVRDRPAADGQFWYALDRGILHQSGYVLYGPPASEMFADLSPVDLRALLVEALSWWLARPTPPSDEPAPGAEDAVLGACRSLVRFRDGEWLSKDAAGRRLLENGIAPELIERCLQARRGDAPPSAAEARAFQQQVLDEIRASSPRGTSTPDDLISGPSV
jgi:hypothetical protein